MVILTLFETQTLQDLAQYYVDEVKAALRNKPIKRKSVHNPDGFQAVANATGRLANSIHFEFTDEAIEVRSLAYIDNIIYGQPPGQKVDVSAIEEWLTAKGLDYNPNTVVSNLKEVGSSIWNEYHGENSGLLLDIHLDKKIEEIKQKIADHGIQEMADTIFKELQLAA